MSRKLNDLTPPCRNKVMHLLARLVEAGIPVMIIETLRSAEKHAADVAAGRSWTAHSKHQDGLAIDLCPYETFRLHGEDKLNWDADDPVWQVIGPLGESVGLIWGGRWKQKDLGHFEMPKEAPATNIATTYLEDAGG